MTDVLNMTGMTKHFGSVAALSNVDFSVAPGEIHALLGVNGAGKSTLVKIISGLYAADEGDIRIDGELKSIHSPRDAIDCGIASVQQHPELVGSLSGYENIFLGQEADDGGLFRKVNRQSMKARAEKLLERFPIPIDLSTKLEDMESVERETVAILHALKQEHTKLLILDEPTSTLTQTEANKLFDVMRALKQSGIGIIYITHRLEEIREIADRVTIFRDGRSVAVLDAGVESLDEAAISRHMLQEELEELFPAKGAAVGEDEPPLLEAIDLGVDGAFNNVNLTLRRGEIVGGFGLVGSGVEAVAMTLFGAVRPTSGEIKIKGETANLKGPRDALRKGIFLVPGDRKAEGLTLTKTITFNVTLANLQRATYLGGLLRRRRNVEDVAGILEALDLRPPQLWRRASEFSGGNQQKVVLAKGLFRKAEIYVFVEPTVGVDIGARSKLYALMRELSKEAAVLILSSDVDEVFGVADSIFALYRGRTSIPQSRGSSREALLSGGLMGSMQ